jgi:hypothetical protein
MPLRFQEPVGQAFDLLLQELQPFVEAALRATYREKWLDITLGTLRSHREGPPTGDVLKWDVPTVLLLVHEQWFHVFRNKLQALDRSLVNELREFRTRWAQQSPFTFEDAYRTLDSIRRLLTSCGSPQTDRVAGLMEDLLRVRMREVSDQEVRTTTSLQNRNWWLLLYAVCAVAIVFQAWQAFGEDSLIFSGLVILTFVYLSWTRLRRPEPVAAKVQECVRCGRIIYGTPCPYCTAHRAEKVPAAAAH